MFLKKQKNITGFSLVEILVSVAIFCVLALGMLATVGAVNRSVKIAREKIILSSLASNYLEIVRNMPYAQVGTIGGNPVGQLPDSSNAVSQVIGATTYRIYYEVTYVDDPADYLISTPSPNTDIYAADYKQVKMNILNTSTNQVTNFVTNVVPAGLEGTSGQGAIRIQVIDSQGNPVPAANVAIRYPALSPTQVLSRQTDASGYWTEVGLAPAANHYRIEITKAGYSSDQTYPITSANPSPLHPDVTVASGTLTSITFAIDLLANLNIRTLDEICQPLSGVNVNVRGAKLIGTPTSTPTSASLYKFNNNYTSSAGLIALNNIEWDTYTPTLLTGQSVIVYGTSPIQKIDVLPGTTQTYTMILGSNSTANSLLVIVKDAGTGGAIEGATVHLQKGGSTPQDYYGTTGGSVWVQSSWVGGGGSSVWSSTTTNQYFVDDGNIDINSNPTGVRLRKVSGDYLAAGTLESSTFDTGTSATNYTILTWQPTSQNIHTTLRFQVAASNDTSQPWNYVGPDGTFATYYTTPGVDIGSALDSKRYVRYKAYLSTTDDKFTPVLTSINLNFVTGCFTPGQVMFKDLTSGNNYDLYISAPGYQDEILNGLNITTNQSQTVEMSP